MTDYPHEFLGRCQTCLDNANLSTEPCRVGYGIGQPVNVNNCLIYRARKAYDAEMAEKNEVRTK